MNQPDPRTHAAFSAAAQHIRTTMASLVENVSTHLGVLAVSAHRVIERDALISAQLDLRRNTNVFLQTFGDNLDKRVNKEINPRPDGKRSLANTDWHSMSLVNDAEVEEKMFADRIGQAIAHVCDTELRDLATFTGSLLGIGRADQDRNPFRPEVLGEAVFRGITSSSNDSATRKLLAKELATALARTMPGCYADILKDFRARGIQPVSLSVRGVEGPGNELTRDRVNSGYDTLHNTSTSTLRSQLGPASISEPERGALPHTTGQGGRSLTDGGRYSRAPSQHGASSQADAELMTLIRRLTFLASRPAELTHPTASAGSGNFVAGHTGSLVSGKGDLNAGSMREVNLIHAHREALQKASTGTLDHMVIDVVGSLFDQILSDPKVPPQMARQIARLQLPVLRVALSDSTFFSSRKHPVRQFVNRIASLACAFDDFDSGHGRQFLEHVRGLVQEIVQGDFDQMEVYSAKLNVLESFIAQQAKENVEKNSSANTVVDNKESDLRVQQRYMQQLQSALAPLSLQPYLRDFLAQVWSQAIAMASKKEGPKSELLLRLKRVGRDLVLSVQPKGSPILRQKFLMQLPALMKDLNEGLRLVGWPEAAQKDFFAKLLPAHAESLKGHSLSELEYNLLGKQLEGIFNIAVPEPDGLLHDMPLVAQTHEATSAAPIEVQFSPEEAERIGLVQESAVNWSGEIDIDLDAQAEQARAEVIEDTVPTPLGTPEQLPQREAANAAEIPQASDIELPFSPTEPAEPTQGAQLINHVQIGFVYQMNSTGEWQKVRLSHISPGRTFFVFTTGKRQTETVSLTARMLLRMCEEKRFRALESAYLIERATARARKQLAELSARR
jgi:hypothetical protein